jgi:hypothetical protein
LSSIYSVCGFWQTKLRLINRLLSHYLTTDDNDSQHWMLVKCHRWSSGVLTRLSSKYFLVVVRSLALISKIEASVSVMTAVIWGLKRSVPAWLQYRHIVMAFVIPWLRADLVISRNNDRDIENGRVFCLEVKNCSTPLY